MRMHPQRFELLTAIEWQQGSPLHRIAATTGRRAGSVHRTLKRLAGAAQTPSETKKILKAIPSASDNDATFMSKARAARRILESKRTAEVSAIGAAGKDTRGFEQKPSGRRVRAVSPDGKRGTLRADQAAAAKAKGWTIEGFVE